MESQNKNVQAGYGVKVLQDQGNGSTVRERQGNRIKLDIENKFGEHERDVWIPLNDIISFTKSDLDEHTREMIMIEIKKRLIK